LFPGEAAPGLGPAADFPFLSAPRKGSQRRRWNTSFPAFGSGASATNPPHDHCLRLHRDRTRHGRAGPLQLAPHRSTPRRPGESRDPQHRWAPAFAGV